MVKRFLIDGYNLAHKLNPRVTRENLQSARDEVERKASLYATRKNLSVTLVFDGRGVLGATEQRGKVCVVFTASGESADARIKKMIDETPNKSALCVVSSDNEILRYASLARAKTMRSEEFLSDLNPDLIASKAKPSKVPPDDKPESVSSGDIEEMKKLFQ